MISIGAPTPRFHMSGKVLVALPNGTAAFRQILVETVAVTVGLLAVDCFCLDPHLAESPVERDHRTIRVLPRIAFVRDGIRIVDHLVLIVGQRVVRGLEMTIQALLQSRAQAGLHLGVTGSHVVHTMDDDDISRLVARMMNDLVGDTLVLQDGSARVRHILRSGIFSGHALLHDIIGRRHAPARFRPYASHRVRSGRTCRRRRFWPAAPVRH